MAEMKAQGLEYNDRMAKLEELEYPKPLSEFVYASFNEFRERNPWVAGDTVRPKSIVREMFEEFLTFSGYIKRYGLERSEGILLRHINSVYKVLAHTVPAAYKTEEVNELESYLKEMLHRIDSSLLEEWERLRNPEFVAEQLDELSAFGAEGALEQNLAMLESSVRTRVMEFLSAASRRDYEGALDCLDMGEESEWTAQNLLETFADYRSEHGEFRMDGEGRAKKNTEIEKTDSIWTVRQRLLDFEGMDDWQAEFTVDTEASKAAGAPVMRLVGVGAV
jgi:hypothetical protein